MIVVRVSPIYSHSNQSQETVELKQNLPQQIWIDQEGSPEIKFSEGERELWDKKLMVDARLAE